MKHVERSIEVPQAEVAAFEAACSEAEIDPSAFVLSAQNFGPAERARRVVTVQKGSNAATFEANHHDAAWIPALLEVAMAWK